MIDSQVEKILTENSRPRDWAQLENRLKPVPVSQVNGQKVYQFFDVLDDSLQVSSQVISVSIQPVESYVPLHVHDYIELTIPIKGDCTVATTGEKVNLEQDDIMIMGNHTVHTVEAISSGQMVISIALRQTAFSLSDLDTINDKRGIAAMLFSLVDQESNERGYTLFHIRHNVKITEFIEDILYEYYFPDKQSSQLIRLDLLQIFTRLIRLAAKHPTMTASQKVGKHEGNYLKILLYILELSN